MLEARRQLFFVAVLWILAGQPSGTAKADFQVNSYTTGWQGAPSVAMEEDGDFFVVWHSGGGSGADTGFSPSIQGQRFASDGQPVGGQFQVNSTTLGSQETPKVAMDAAGNAVVVWISDDSAGTDSWFTSVQAQRLASDGTAIGGEFQVNTYTTNTQDECSAAMGPGGDFVVVWRSNGSSGTDTSNQSIQARRFASDGTAIGGEFQVNTFTTDTQAFPGVAVGAGGDFVVVWDSLYQLLWSAQGQRFASDGSFVGEQFQISTHRVYSAVPTPVAMTPDSGFVVVWTSRGTDETDWAYSSVQARRYDSDGSPIGSLFQVNTYITGHQYAGAVAIGADGGFVVTWGSLGSSGTDPGYSIQGQRFASDGSAVSGEFQVNTLYTGFQNEPALAMSPAGSFVVVWQSDTSAGTDTSLFSVQARRFFPLLGDGFESGDTSAWSAVAE